MADWGRIGGEREGGNETADNTAYESRVLTRVEENASRRREGVEGGISGGVSFWHFVVLSPVPRRQGTNLGVKARPFVLFAMIRKGITRGELGRSTRASDHQQTKAR